MKRRDIEKRPHEMGWRMIRHGARHDVWARGDNEIVVPRHGEINEYTARAILREAGGKQ
jgi:predicted RNA binding protein YcfA (HicA-like mRNA interferase family)